MQQQRPSTAGKKNRLQLQKDTRPARDGGHHRSRVGTAGLIGEFYYYVNGIFLKRKNTESFLKSYDTGTTVQEKRTMT